MRSFLKTFFAMEAANSLLLLLMLFLAMAAANSALSPYYELLHGPTPVVVINKGLMALFFLCIGIEIKTEIKEGSLAHHSHIVLPLVATLCGICTPVLIYSFCNWSSAGAMRGWAIPSATDIALSLAVLNSFGPRVPRSLRMLLMSIAVFDDLAAIAIIALFYSQAIYWPALGVAVICAVLLYIYSVQSVRLAAFMFAGAALWVALLDAGVSPTVAGIVLGLALPLTHGRRVREFLYKPVIFGVLPVFIFANAGISFTGLTSSAIVHPTTVGIAAGLFLGKQLGIFTAAFSLIKLGIARMPEGATWAQVYSMAILCGIGFTMNLFVGSLAFGNSAMGNYAKLGVITGALASAVAGVICMTVSLNAKTIKK